MAVRPSAFAILGLEPGADAAAVEQAYKRLIKVHHPDRQGGDPKRAAELNWAYRELRERGAPSERLELNDVQGDPRRRARWPVAALVAGAAIGGLLLGMGPSTQLSSGRVLPQHGMRQSSWALAATDVHADVIDKAVKDAAAMVRHRDEMALAAASRDCHERFRQHPDARLLDRCAAFDDAVVVLQDRDPFHAAGPFAPLAVIGRQWSAASMLSTDSLVIDSHLDQVRLRVELALVPAAPADPPAEPDAAAD